MLSCFSSCGQSPSLLFKAFFKISTMSGWFEKLGPDVAMLLVALVGLVPGRAT